MKAITFIGGQVESKDDAIKEHYTLRKIHSEYSADNSGVYNWGQKFAKQGNTSNSITIGTGKGVVYGRHFEIDVAETVSILDGTSTTQYGYVIIKIDMTKAQGSQVALTHKAQTGSYPTLTKQDVTGNTGVYEMELVKFTYNNTSILTSENVARTPFSTNGVLTGKAADSEKLDGLDSTAYEKVVDVGGYNNTSYSYIDSSESTITFTLDRDISTIDIAKLDIAVSMDAATTNSSRANACKFELQTSAGTNILTNWQDVKSYWINGVRGLLQNSGGYLMTTFVGVSNMNASIGTNPAGTLKISSTFGSVTSTTNACDSGIGNFTCSTGGGVFRKIVFKRQVPIDDAKVSINLILRDGKKIGITVATSFDILDIDTNEPTYRDNQTLPTQMI